MFDFEIDKKEIYRYLGYDAEKHHMTAEMHAQIERCIAVTLRAIDAREACSPILDIVDTDNGKKVDVMPLVGEDISAHLKGCDRAILMAVTLGSVLDGYLRRVETIDMTSAVIMDAVANVAIEQYADEVEQKLRTEIKSQGLYMTGRYSPGYGDMPLSCQRYLLAIVSAEKRAGITLTPTNLMIPRKSITAVLGVADIPVTGKRAGCNHCVMRDKCVYRKRGTTCDK